MPKNNHNTAIPFRLVTCVLMFLLTSIFSACAKKGDANAQPDASKSRTPEKHLQEMQAPQMRFLGEQDGPPERELKTALIDFFRSNSSVHAAFLVRAAYGEAGTVNVVLCLRTQSGDDPKLAGRIGRVFASMFGSHEHLDILFLDDEREGAVRKVASPFYEAVKG